MSTHETLRPTLPPEALSLPAHYYTDPANHQAELERFFFCGWIHAGRADQLRSPSDYVLRDVGGESVIVTRAEDGAIRAFYNVCRHRGTRLCETPEGRFPGLIRCPYHAWCFDLEGELIAAPQMDDLPHFRKQDYPLVSPAIGLWDGHIFLNLSHAEVAPLLSHLRDLPDRFRAWQMADLRHAKRVIYNVAANWKLIIQNYSECLHCPGVHPTLQRLSHFLAGENEPANPSYLGGWMNLREGIETLSMDGKRHHACLPGLEEPDRRRVHYYAVMPNLLLSLHPDYVMTHTLWPHAVDRTEIVCEWHFHPDTLADPRFSPGNIVDFWDMTNRQDWHVCEQMQLGLRSRAYRPGPYSRREDLLFAFDRLIRSDPD
jgi:Rieske 2Fe-2S family protein